MILSITKFIEKIGITWFFPKRNPFLKDQLLKDKNDKDIFSFTPNHFSPGHRK